MGSGGRRGMTNMGSGPNREGPKEARLMALESNRKEGQISCALLPEGTSA